MKQVIRFPKRINVGSAFMRDSDRDGVPNFMDCQPRNPNKQGRVSEWAKKKYAEYQEKREHEKVASITRKAEQRKREGEIRERVQAAEKEAYYAEKEKYQREQATKRARQRARGQGGFGGGFGSALKSFASHIDTSAPSRLSASLNQPSMLQPTIGLGGFAPKKVAKKRRRKQKSKRKKGKRKITVYV